MATNLNLLTHCGAHKVSREVLRAVQAPESTQTFQPISHESMVSNIERQLTKIGLDVVQEVHAVSHEGLRYFGMLEVRNGSEHSDYSTVLGIRNTNDKSFRAGMVIGSGVFVCDNLCFSGEIEVGRMHTLNILNDLPDLILNALKLVGAAQGFQDKRIAAYRETELTDTVVNNLLIEAFDAKVISSNKIGRVLTEWRAPRHQEFVDAGQTAWRLMNAFTETLKPGRLSNLFALPTKTQALHTILDRVSGVDPANDLGLGKAA